MTNVAHSTLTGADLHAPGSHTHPASDIASGVIAMARLATGTPDGTKYVRDDGTLAVPPGSGNVANMVPTLVVGQYYDLATMFLLTAGTAALTINTLYAIPFYNPYATTWDRIACNVTAFGTSGNVRMGIYAFTAGVPGALVLDAGAVAAGSNGVKTITISKLLAADTWYFLALVLDVAATLTTLATAGIGIRGTTDPSVNPVAGVNKSFTYAALPDPFGAIAGTTNNVPRIMLRAS